MRSIFVLSLIVALNAATPCQTAIIPIVGGASTLFLLGGVQNGKWIAPGDVAPKMKDETEFVLIGLNGVDKSGVAKGKKLKMGDFSSGQAMEFDLSVGWGVAIGSEAKWNLVPRLPKTIDLNDPSYRTVISNFLKKKGIARPIVKIVQAFRIDLEGDGIEEVLLSAAYQKRGAFSLGAQVGDYSFVLLQKAEGESVAHYLLEGNFVTKRTDSRVLLQNEIWAIADLNGDGKMEIVIPSIFAYGDSTSVIEMKAEKPIKIKEFEM